MQREEIRIVKKVLNVNGNVVILYELPNGVVCYSPFEVLKNLFQTQGKLYEYLGISQEMAEKAGWRPESDKFSLKDLGFRKFLADKGRITVRRVEKEMTLEDFLNEMYLNYGYLYDYEKK
jgi:3-polyprenyl-4-hydroxybenzoate decarboxylase